MKIDLQTGRILHYQTLNFGIVPGFLFTCRACEDKIPPEQMDYYQDVCANCAQSLEEHQQEYDQDREEEWKRDTRYDKYRDLAAENMSGTKLMSGKDIRDRGIEDSAGFGYGLIILQDGSSVTAGWVLPDESDDSRYYVTDMDLNERTNQMKLVKWLHPELIKGLHYMNKWHRSQSMDENIENYFGKSALAERTQADLEDEYKQTQEYKLWAGISPAVAIEVQTLFEGIIIMSRQGVFNVTGNKRHELKPPILLSVYENPQTINNRVIR